MIIGERLKATMKAAGMNQSELARRVGVSQPTIYRAVSGQLYGTRNLHRIARELRTTPAYLTGETDDPHADLPPPSELDADARELVDYLDRLSPADRRALLQVAKSMAQGPKSSGTVHPLPPAYEGNPSESAASIDPDPNASNSEQS